MHDKPRQGRPPLLDSAYHEALTNSILKAHDSPWGGRLTGQDIVILLKDKWGVSYSVSGVYELLKSLGIVWISSRSKHPKQNQERQNEFKKTLETKH